MSGRKNRSLVEAVRAFAARLQKTGENLDATFQRVEKRFEDSEKAFEQFGARLEDKFQRIDKRIEAFEKKMDLILETDGLKKRFPVRSGKGVKKGSFIRAVDGVDLAITSGETLGIVGESGCGKSTVARVLTGLTPPSEGAVRLFGKDLSSCDKIEKKEIRRRIGIVFQDPYGSLDPRMTVAEIVGEPLRAYKLCSTKQDRLLRVLQTLKDCGLDADSMFKFPHQFSGGQRQRICIARALVAGPDIVVCDEAVSALDVSIQAQIINLLCDLKETRSLTYIFISHDLDVVRFIADRVAVMYMGKIVEMAQKDALFDHPMHPYTRALLNSAPVFGRRDTRPVEPAGLDEAPGDGDAGTGCRYRSRCPMAVAECALSEPLLRNIDEGHAVACHRA